MTSNEIELPDPQACQKVWLELVVSAVVEYDPLSPRAVAAETVEQSIDESQAPPSPRSPVELAETVVEPDDA